ncbi:MAG: hypothetical protein IJH38_09300 [Clostridia bacterium]|nr:hypothetical protein [Clostridia bacterium]
MRKALRLIALLMAALALLGASASPAVQTGPGIPPVNDDGPDALYPGNWVTFEDGFKLYLPSAWQPEALTSAERQAGLFYSAGNGGRDDLVGACAMGLGVGYMSAGALSTTEALAEDLRQAGCSEVEPCALNGIPCVRFLRSRDNYRGVAFFHPAAPDYILTVYIYPVGEAGTPQAELGRAVLDSLSPWQLNAAP